MGFRIGQSATARRKKKTLLTSTVFRVSSFVSSDVVLAAPETTWYVSKFFKFWEFAGSKRNLTLYDCMLPELNASSTGANTVNGPFPDKTVSNFAVFRAVVSVLRRGWDDIMSYTVEPSAAKVPKARIATVKRISALLIVRFVGAGEITRLFGGA